VRRFAARGRLRGGFSRPIRVCPADSSFPERVAPSPSTIVHGHCACLFCANFRVRGPPLPQERQQQPQCDAGWLQLARAARRINRTYNNDNATNTHPPPSQWTHVVPFLASDTHIYITTIDSNCTTIFSHWVGVRRRRDGVQRQWQAAAAVCHRRLQFV